MKKQSVAQGTLILVVAGLITKILGNDKSDYCHKVVRRRRNWNLHANCTYIDAY